MPQYVAQGSLPQKRYTLMYKPDGSIYYEHYISADGFAGDTSFLYRISAPGRVTRVEDMPQLPLRSNGPPIARNLLFQYDRISGGGDFIDARTPAIFSGRDLVFNVAKPTEPMTRFYCNTQADELVLIVKGTGKLESLFGDIPYEPLDLVYVPRGDVVRWVTDPGPQEFAVIESREQLRSPPEFIKENGQFDDGASYHERDLKTPILREPVDIAGEHAIVMKVGTHYACSWLDHHPFDVVGWDGTLYPYALNLKDYEPIVGHIFRAPDQYPVFATSNTLITAITPRQMPDIADGAFGNSFHQNLDYDEVLFRFDGTVGKTEPSTGTFTLIPRAIMHGPKPGFEREERRTHIHWWGLMLDTRLTLEPTLQAMATNDPSFARTSIEDQLDLSREARI